MKKSFNLITLSLVLVSITAFSSDIIKLRFNPNYCRTNGLIHYWSFNSHIRDEVGGAHLFNGSSAGLTFDRFNRSMSALKLASGYYQIPPGNYFKTTEFSILAWVKPGSYGSMTRIIGFSNGPAINEIVLILSHLSTGNPFFIMFEGNNPSLVSEEILILNKWSHVAVTFGKNISLYIDSVLKISQSNNEMYSNMTRSLNYIGKSVWVNSTNTNADADIDELKLFDRALTQQELAFEMNNDIY